MRTRAQTIFDEWITAENAMPLIEMSSILSYICDSSALVIRSFLVNINKMNTYAWGALDDAARLVDQFEIKIKQTY